MLSYMLIIMNYLEYGVKIMFVCVILVENEMFIRPKWPCITDMYYPFFARLYTLYIICYTITELPLYSKWTYPFIL